MVHALRKKIIDREKGQLLKWGGEKKRKKEAGTDCSPFSPSLSLSLFLRVSLIVLSSSFCCRFNFLPRQRVVVQVFFETPRGWEWLYKSFLFLPRLFLSFFPLLFRFSLFFNRKEACTCKLRGGSTVDFWSQKEKGKNGATVAPEGRVREGKRRNCIRFFIKKKPVGVHYLLKTFGAYLQVSSNDCQKFQWLYIKPPILPRASRQI